ncbi:MAG: PDZ domain-containing protein [Alcanivoracaceae bacterium]|nr:PDZ domain-containing protein [Alcanivoracaceae bacterium]
MIRYQIQPLRPEAHLFRIDMTIPSPVPEGQVVRIPAWIPGSYMIRDFARHVVRFDATAQGETLPWRKLDKDSWWMSPTDAPITVSIDVYAWDLSVRGAHLDSTHGYFNGACTFLQPVGHEDLPIEVEIRLPEGPNYIGWNVATGLPRKSGGQWEPGTFTAENYDALIDHPVEMGRFDYATFDACGVPHHVVFTGKHSTDLARLNRDLSKICEHHIRMFGEPAPMTDYLFMTLVTGSGYGGLEHRNSTSLMCARNDLPRRTEDPSVVRSGYRTYLGLCSHEYFHTWNIKRIKPEAFAPYDLTQESYTEQLWAFEGITSYYDDLALVRTGIIDSKSYLELLGQTITRVARGAGTEKQTVTESSFDAWTRFYKQDENASNAIVSYYAKGALIALALDLTLREKSNGDLSLDDLMRQLWQRFGQTGVGVPEHGIQALAEELIGESLKAFFDLALYSTEPLPLEQLLATMGVRVHWRAPAGHADMGGAPAKVTPVNIGVRIADDPLGARVTVAFEQGSAMAAGLSAGDVIVAVDGVKTDARKFDEQLLAYQPGELIELHAFRGDELMRFKITLTPAEETIAWLSIDEVGLTPAGQRWLHVD